MGFLLIGLGVWDNVVLPVWYVFLVVLGLGMLIFVHEFGHFIVAKLCGVKVEKFFLGFDFGGLKLWSFRRGETVYGIGIFPLGGYVKMLGQEDNPARLREEVERAKARQAAAAEGSSGDPEAAPETGEAGPPIDIAAAERALYDPRSYLAKSVPKRMAIISAGVTMNVIFAFVTAVAAYKLGVFQPACGAGQVALGEPAWKEGIRAGDEFLEIAGKPCDRFEDLQRSVSLGDIDHGVTIKVKRSGVPEPFDVTIDPSRDGLAPTIGVVNPLTTTLGKKVPAWPGTAASEAKPALAGGDKIVQIGDEKIADYAQIHRQLALNPDKPMRVVVERQTLGEDGKPGTPERLTVEIPPQPLLRLGLVMEMGPVTAIQEGSPAAQAGIQPGDVLRKIDGQPAGDPMTLGERLRAKAKTTGSATLAIDRGGQEVTLSSVRLRVPDWYEEPLDVRPKSPMSAPALGIAYRVAPRVAEVAAGSSAASAGVKAGDEVVQAKLVPPSREGLEERGYSEAAKEFSLKPISVALEKDASWPSVFYAVQATLPGAQVELTLADGRIVPLKPAPSDGSFNPDRGLRFEHKGTLVQAKTWASAVRLGGEETGESLKMVVNFLRKLKSGQVSFRAMGGPVSIFKMAYYAAEAGLAPLLLFLTLIGANLAVLNILPIPVLDGGHLMFLLYELITGRPPSERVQLALTWVGLLLILALFIMVMGLDIGLISRK